MITVVIGPTQTDFEARARLWSVDVKAKIKLVGTQKISPNESSNKYAGRLDRLRERWQG